MPSSSSPRIRPSLALPVLLLLMLAPSATRAQSCYPSPFTNYYIFDTHLHAVGGSWVTDGSCGLGCVGEFNGSSCHTGDFNTAPDALVTSCTGKKYYNYTTSVGYIKTNIHDVSSRILRSMAISAFNGRDPNLHYPTFPVACENDQQHSSLYHKWYYTSTDDRLRTAAQGAFTDQYKVYATLNGFSADDDSVIYRGLTHKTASEWYIYDHVRATPPFRWAGEKQEDCFGTVHVFDYANGPDAAVQRIFDELRTWDSNSFGTVLHMHLIEGLGLVNYHNWAALPTDVTTALTAQNIDDICTNAGTCIYMCDPASTDINHCPNGTGGQTGNVSTAQEQNCKTMLKALENMMGTTNNGDHRLTILGAHYKEVFNTVSTCQQQRADFLSHLTQRYNNWSAPNDTTYGGLLLFEMTNANGLQQPVDYSKTLTCNIQQHEIDTLLDYSDRFTIGTHKYPNNDFATGVSSGTTCGNTNVGYGYQYQCWADYWDTVFALMMNRAACRTDLTKQQGCEAIQRIAHGNVEALIGASAATTYNCATIGSNWPCPSGCSGCN